ncbi:NUDIX hydrolase domain-like protein [Sparassis latifolia]
MAPGEAKRTPAIPRRSASVIVVNPQNEILLVHRNPKSQSFAGAHVFPGGNYDSQQDDSLEITAIRELFEEAGLLLASSASLKLPSDTELDEAREAIHSQRRLFRDFLSHHSLTADVSSLLPFTQWVTPPTIPRRFRTQFYVAFLQSAPSTGFSAGGKQERLPTPDGGQEVIAARFVHPRTALEESRTQRIVLMPPQVYLLSTLADILQGGENTLAQRERVGALSRGLFGRMVVNPRPLPERDPEGRTILTYEGDETRGGKPGRLHRCHAKFGPGGTATEVVIQRNFDIFTGIEGHLFEAETAKL